MKNLRLVTYIIIISFFFLFSLIVFFNFISKSKKIKQEKVVSTQLKTESNLVITPKLINKNKTQTGNFEIKTNLNNEKEIVSTAVFITADGYGEEKENIFQAKKEDFLKKTPLSSSNFLIVYNQKTGKFDVYLKDLNENSKNKLLNWLKLNGFSQEEIYRFFEIKNQTLNDYLNQTNLTLKPSIGSSDLDTSYKIFIELLRNILSFSSFDYNQTQSAVLSLPNPTISLSYDVPQGYNPNTRGCYTPKRFIEVYADGLIPTGPPNCYQNVKEKVESYLVYIDFLGGKVRVHQKTLPYFQAVNNDLLPYQVNGRTFRFNQGLYTFSYLGTYAFRCNVNASTTKDVWNVCDPGCVLSPHSFGFAIDINPQTNQNHSDYYDMPPEVVSAFRRHGFRWGGEWKDAMHFEYLGEICPN